MTGTYNDQHQLKSTLALTELSTQDTALARTANILRSILGNGTDANTALIAEIPELGQITGTRAAALTGLAPIAGGSGAMRGKRLFGGDRR